ncbi:23S rRNA (uracil(1939)-C(5))-methyltransferase RlmD [Pontiella sulfatireligans]|uniref:23S rRNA (Uracil-C(5))-methyltransferase RlmCD n=1 Tax=Pontiella sulfatireligans TaxID=2750658 RepID=A0A6C2ULC9_9BACT|nr:23S rRNA (uracil(1939)-C(5))-methyltransferase RlmD [Pontiella sulfatireligans]VGO21045.1 23S rRNA (uracil-C(5))-methyltransferase RlmCD [Pontiella sulfatireligans]
MYKKKQIVEVEIIDLGDKNQCFGRLDDGMSIFVQGTAAVDDVVKAEIFKIKKKFLAARMCELVKPSPHRIEPVCPYFGLCGGCKWQHMDYSEQLRLKRKQVQDALEHLGGFKEVECTPCIPAPELFGYRNKMDFSFTDLRYLTSEEIDIPADQQEKPLDFALGFHAPGCYSKAIDINHCDLSTEEMNSTLNAVRKFCLEHKNELPIYSTRSHTGELRNLVVRHGGHTGEFMVNLVTSTHNPPLMKKLSEKLQAVLGDRLTTFVNNITSAKNTVAFGEKEYVLHGPGYITDRLGDYTYRISANSFFQTNTAQAEKLYLQILESAQLKPSDIVYDLFCGTGSITLFASGHCQKVLGVELVESSVRDARANAKRHNVSNCEFIQLDLKDIKLIEQDMKDFGAPDVVITDPPRAGMNPRAVKMLLVIAPPAIVYVSCNPASLARDGQMLCENGQYKLVSCQPIDMFPQTNHVESVARFERI